MFDQKLLDDAMHVRHVTLGMLITGVVSSDTNVSQATMASQSPLGLARLLEYSESTRKHAALFRVLWGSLPNNPTVSEDLNEVFGASAKADLVYQTAERGQICIFQLSGKHVGPQTSGRNVTIATAIMQNNLRFQGLWAVDYTYLDHDQNGMVETTDLRGTNIYPERQTLLHFYMSPERLSGDEVGRLIPGSSDLLSVIHFERVYTYRGFRHFQFRFEGADLGRKYLRDSSFELFRREGNFLLSRGSLHFCVVELGTTEIGGETHWIYTGSERVEGQLK